MRIDPAAWQVVEAPGYAGKGKAARDASRDRLYGAGNWKSAFRWGDDVVERDLALQLYEDAYWTYFRAHPEQVDWLCATASEVYDNAVTNVASGLDYAIQESGSTHLQDIAVRRCLLRLGRRFAGDHLVEIRGRGSEGYHLNPGQVPFHLPQMIVRREGNPGWIKPGTIEEFWQSNKVLVVRPRALRPILAVDVIVRGPDGQVLVIDRTTEPAGWALPGGKLEYGETLAAAAMREVREETGLTIELTRRVGVYDTPGRDPRHQVVSVVFEGRAATLEGLAPGDGVKRARCFAPNGLPPKLAFDHAQILADYFAANPAR